MLAAGQRLVAAMTLHPAEDARLFSGIGTERSVQLLMAVLSYGQKREATALDWTNLHRATEGLVELYSSKGEHLRAAIFSTAQSGFYRNLEHDYEAALTASRQALEFQQRSGFKENVELSWAAIGRDLMSLGRAEDALVPLRESWRLVVDRSAARGARIGRDLVQALLATGRIDEAGREAAVIFGPDGAYARADVRIAQERFGEALDILATVKDTGSPEISAQLLTCLLTGMRSLDYAASLQLAGRIEKEFPGMAMDIGPFARQALVMRRRLAGDVDGVLRDEARQLEAAQREGNPQRQIELLVSMASTYQSANSVSQRIAALEQALEIERGLLPPGGVPTNIVQAKMYLRELNYLGEACLDNKEYGRARRAHGEAVKTVQAFTSADLRSRTASYYGQALLGLARIAAAGDEDDARSMLDRALAAQPADATFARTEVLLESARLARGMREYPRAMQHYRQCLQELHKERGLITELAVRIEYIHFLTTNAPRIPDARNLAGIEIKTARSAAAALRVANLEWRLEYEAGLLAEDSNQTGAARVSYTKAAGLLDLLRGGLTQADQRRALLDQEAAGDLYRRLLTLLTQARSTDAAWRYLERGKARAFLEDLKELRFAPQPEAAAGVKELAAVERRIQALRLQLLPQNEALLRGAGKEPALLHAELGRLEGRFALLRGQSALLSHRSTNALALEPLTLAAVRARLPAHTALIEYGILSNGLTAFVVTRTGAWQETWKLDTESLRKKVLGLRVLLTDERSASILADAVKELSLAILAPLAARIPAGTQQIVVSPAAWLNYLPFHVLELKPGHPLLEDYAVSYLPSASILAFLGTDPRKGNRLFLGALGRVSTEGWPELPGTTDETRAVAAIFPQAVRASEREFTHDRAIAALREYDIVHFATHGVLDERAPLFSALLTSSAAAQPTRLSLFELPGIRIAARMVVLSACETGLGRMGGGDEISSLGRTFLMAGAATVVSSLWKVSDESTALLMREFYRGLAARLSPARAMRAAMIDVRKRYPHPFFWAPFQVIGAAE